MIEAFASAPFVEQKRTYPDGYAVVGGAGKASYLAAEAICPNGLKASERASCWSRCCLARATDRGVPPISLGGRVSSRGGRSVQLDEYSPVGPFAAFRIMRIGDIKELGRCF